MALLQRLKSLLGIATRHQRTHQDRGTEPTDGRTGSVGDTTSQYRSEDGPTASDRDADREEAAPDTESVEAIDGIGPAYSDRLADADIDTVADLAAADAQTLADQTDISPARLERWIDRAQSRT